MDNSFITELTEMCIDKLRKAVSAITPMAPESLKILLPFLQKRKGKKGGLIVKENEVCRNIFFLCTGFARMYYLDEEGNEINYRFTEAGNFFDDFQSFLTRAALLSVYFCMTTYNSFACLKNDLYQWLITFPGQMISASPFTLPSLSSII